MPLQKTSYKVAIIGCGMIAGGYDTPESGTIMTHAGAVTNSTRFKLAGVHDSNKEKADAFGQKWGIPTQFSSVDDLLKKTRPDVIAICTPTEHHLATLAAALTHKPIAVICEKPLDNSPETAQQMVAMCRQAGTSLFVNYIRHWDPTLKALAAQITRGDFGQLQLGRAIHTKGMLHNGSHAISLFNDFFGRLRFKSFSRLVPWGPHGDVSAAITLSTEAGSEVIIQGLDDACFNVFEVELFMEQARIVLSGGGHSIEIYRTNTSSLVPGQSVLANTPTTIPGTLRKSMQFVYAELANTLDQGLVTFEPEHSMNAFEIFAELRGLKSE